MIQIQKLSGETPYGPSYASPAGAIACFAPSPFDHRFGGDSWTVRDQRPVLGGPSLVLVLDLADPLCAGLEGWRSRELPLCSYLSCDLWVHEQIFHVDVERRIVTLLGRREPATDAYAPELEHPLPERPLDLRPMQDFDFPISEEAYWSASDSFVGGDRFLRVLGPPLWMQEPLQVSCPCGREMRYAASMGYPKQATGRRNDSGGGIFIGEGILYWFVCADCSCIGVISQEP